MTDEENFNQAEPLRKPHRLSRVILFQFSFLQQKLK